MQKNKLKSTLPGSKKQGGQAIRDQPGIAAKVPSPSQLWATSVNAVWTCVRRRYGDAVAAVGSSGKPHKAAFSSLDRWYHSELSPSLQPPQHSQPPQGGTAGGGEGGTRTRGGNLKEWEGATRHITRQQLEKLVEWKLARGQWRPRLLSYAQKQPEGVVEAASTKALAAMRNYLPPPVATATASTASTDQHCDTALRTAVDALTTLKGVGPATASALLSAACPYVPYMGDEALVTCLSAGLQSGYSIKTYLELTSRLQCKATELNQQQQDEATGDVQNTPGPMTGAPAATAAAAVMGSAGKDQPPLSSDAILLHGSGGGGGTNGGGSISISSGGASTSTGVEAGSLADGGSARSDGRKPRGLCRWTAADVERCLWIASVLSQQPHPQQSPNVEDTGGSDGGDRPAGGSRAGSGPPKRARR